MKSYFHLFLQCFLQDFLQQQVGKGFVVLSEWIISMAIAIYAVLQTGCLWGFPVLHQILQPIRFWDPNGKLSCHCKCYEQYFFLYILFFNAAETKTVLPLYFWLDHNLILRKNPHQRHQRYRGEQILIDVIAETVVYRSVYVYSTNTSPMNILSTVFSFSWSSGITESDRLIIICDYENTTKEK